MDNEFGQLAVPDGWDWDSVHKIENKREQLEAKPMTCFLCIIT